MSLNPNPDPEDLIPEGAPPELINLATNINEILTPIQKIRGIQYTRQLLILCTLFQQSAQLEEIACQSTGLISAHLPEYQQSAFIKHETTHMLGDAISSSLHRLVSFFEELQEYRGISRDLETMMNRIKSDWTDKIGH